MRREARELSEKWASADFVSIERVKVKEAEVGSKKYAVDRDEAKLMVLSGAKERQEAELTAESHRSQAGAGANEEQLAGERRQSSQRTRIGSGDLEARRRPPSIE